MTVKRLTLEMPLFYRFVCKNNGVLFENQLLQIGIKSEYRQNLGELSSLKSSLLLGGHLYQMGRIAKWAWPCAFLRTLLLLVI